MLIITVMLENNHMTSLLGDVLKLLSLPKRYVYISLSIDEL